MGTSTTYTAKTFDLSDLTGISNETLAMHFKLYEGYVTNTNVLNQRIADLIGTGTLDPTQSAAFSELKRRFGFEYNGMVLHEYYFENMQKHGTGDPSTGDQFVNAATDSFGDYDVWKADFMNTGKMRGVGWAAVYQDPSNGQISNHWINLHETGNVAGYKPILIMDVWEHAFIKDYAPVDRPKYIEAFFANINWDVVNSRLG
ncbi:MAG TPA: Fe-Mn family superoxide dismutase [Pyrinomonadaceae bacterium]|nr:superoxide dismutase [Acidobacteriota bacterium]HQZ95447.1 Fe-Mn family superoxide dismutase [Pyrinomonadaceae bacterium]